MVVPPVGEVVHVLHADDRCHRAGFGNLLSGDVTDSELADQFLLLEAGEGLHGFGDRAWLGAVGISHAHVHQVEALGPQGFKVVPELLAQLLGSARGWPAALGVAVRADLGGDQYRLRIRMQRLTNQLVGDPRAVGVAGVDVRDALRDRLA